MYAKFFLVSALIGYAAAACNSGAFQSKCGKYGEMMQQISSSQGQPDISKLCCILNEQVSCIEGLGCGDAMSQVLTPAKAQIAQLCQNQAYVKGCSEAGGAPSGGAPSGGAPAPEAESEAEATEAPESASIMSSLPSLCLIIISTLLLKFYN